MNKTPAIVVNIAAFSSLLLFILNAQAQRCPGVNFQRVGCYREKTKESHPLSDLLFTDRKSTCSKWTGVKYAFQEFNAYLADLTCRCAKATKLKGYTTFGLTHYGDCYSSDDASPKFAKSATSSHCVTMNFGLCQESSALCMGQQHSIFVFKLTVTGKTEKSVKSVSASLIQKKLLKIVKSSKSSISDLACSSYRTTILLGVGTFTNELENYQSSSFMEYRREIELGILQAYDEDQEFQEVQVLKFSAGFESKIVVTILIKFKKKGKHLGALLNRLASQKLGHMRVFPALGDCGCYGGIIASPWPPSTSSSWWTSSSSSPATHLHPTTTFYPHPGTHIHHELTTPSLCPPECNVTCGSACNPSCCTSEAPAATVSYSVPTSVASLPQSPPSQCTAPCGSACAPACTPACCYTIYRPQMINYWKRHRLYTKGHISLKMKNKNIRGKADFISKTHHKNV